MVLKRPLHPMPAFVCDALEEDELMASYDARPAYQRNDYLRWIASPALEQTRRKRLDQMLDELKRGDVYMNMKWNGGTD